MLIQVMLLSSFLAMAPPPPPDALILHERPILIEWYSIEGTGVVPTDTALSDLEVFISDHLPGREVTIRAGGIVPFESWDGTDASIDRFFRAMGGGPGRIMIIYGPSYSRWMVRGLERGEGPGAAAILIDSSRMRGRGRNRWIEESRILRHEAGHALGLVWNPAHREERRGGHCTDPNCLMHGRLRLSDLLAWFWPNLFAGLVPDELCEDCARDLAGAGPSP